MTACSSDELSTKIVTPGIGIPAESVTLPVTTNSCAYIKVVKNSNRLNKILCTFRILFIFFIFFIFCVYS